MEIDYGALQKLIHNVYDNRIDDGPFFIFMLAHLEVFKDIDGTLRNRFKTLGNLQNKVGIEGHFVHCYYTNIDTGKKEDDVSRYRFSVHNNNFNTARSPMGYWPEPHIENNLQKVIDKVIEMEY